MEAVWFGLVSYLKRPLKPLELPQSVVETFGQSATCRRKQDVQLQ